MPPGGEPTSRAGAKRLRRRAAERLRRALLAGGLAATAATMACGSDQSTNSPPPPTTTAAALALHFDTLAGELKASKPTDIRLTWYQKIASILARGVSPSGISVHLGGGPAVLEAGTEIDAFADSVNGKKIADSTYHLLGWAPSTRPTQFLDMRVRFLPAGTGKPDTTATYIMFYGDTSGNFLADSTEIVGYQVLSNRGLCQITALQNLTVPSNPCTKVAVDWLAGGGTDLLFINPQVQVSGTHLTQ